MTASHNSASFNQKHHSVMQLERSPVRKSLSTKAAFKWYLKLKNP